MSSPNERTNPEILALILDNMGNWFIKHDSSLLFVVGNNYNGSQRAKQLAARVRKIESTFQTERRQDVEVTRLQNVLFKDIQIFLSSVGGLIQFVFSKKKHIEQITKTFIKFPPSRVRNINTAGQALNYTTAAIKQHIEEIDRSFSRTETLLEQSADLSDRIFQLDALDNTEIQETRAARHARTEQVAEALDFIREAKMAAMSVEFASPEVFRDLRIIFESHLPKRFKTVDKIIDQVGVGTD